MAEMLYGLVDGQYLRLAIVWEPKGRGTSTVGSCYQAMAVKM
jgi:hypothetical protein